MNDKEKERLTTDNVEDMYRYTEPLVNLRQVDVSSDNRTLDWLVEVVFGKDIYSRREPLNVKGFDDPERDDIKAEFFAKRNLYEKVGEIGKGRVDTGELDFGDATNTVTMIAESIKQHESWKLENSVHTAEEIAEIEAIEREEEGWVREQTKLAIKEGRRPPDI